ncbi:MAG TPA: AMP-binding protein [Thermodesulfobacteriota bacterium]|nr:AMP-binding protein [Thermodesulfobacteriota bacterium]
MSEKTIPELLQNRVKEHGTKLLYQRRDGWSWKQITWLDFDRKVRNIAAFLHDLGFGRGDRALVVSSNRLEAISSELAVFHLGGVIVPLSPGESAAKIIEAANELHPKLIFIEQGAAAEGILGTLPGLGSVARVIIFPDARISNERVLNFKAVLKFGLMKRKKLEDELAGIYKKITPDLPAAIFISPDGSSTLKAEVSEGDLIESLEKASRRCPDLNAEDQAFSYITEASPFAKFVNYLTIYQGSRAAVAEGRKDFYQDIVEVMPTVLYATKAGLEELCGKSGASLNGRKPGKSLRMDLGNRVRHILTDSHPGGETETIIRSAGALLIEVPEFNLLLG